jgi:hypothetical protein
VVAYFLLRAVPDGSEDCDSDCTGMVQARKSRRAIVRIESSCFMADIDDAHVSEQKITPDVSFFRIATHDR